MCLGVFRLYQPFFCLRGGRESADGTEGCCSVIREVRYKLFFTHICPTFECNFTHCIKSLKIGMVLRGWKCWPICVLFMNQVSCHLCGQGSILTLASLCWLLFKSGIEIKSFSYHTKSWMPFAWMTFRSLSSAQVHRNTFNINVSFNTSIESTVTCLMYSSKASYDCAWSL